MNERLFRLTIKKEIRPMKDILHELAKLYQRSTAGRKGASKDFTTDYETFLRRSGCADGDEREIAEKELLAAEAQSGGLFRIDRNPRSGMKIRLRLAHEDGEAWLFAQTDETSPSEDREQLAAFFESISNASVPDSWIAPWHQWFSRLAIHARNGEAIQPFRREDPDGNAEIITALIGVLNWQGPSLVRYASTHICGDSKRLQALEPRLCIALSEITGHSNFESFGIFHKPRSITFHGPLSLPIGETTVDFSDFPAPVTLSEGNFNHTRTISTLAPLCLTVENEDVFHELAATNPGILLIQTSFPGSAALGLIKRLPSNLPFYHFGDSDPAGSDILRDLREKSGRNVSPLLMDYRKTSDAQSNPLSNQELRTIKRLLNMDILGDIHPQLEKALESGTKGSFEQEAIPISEVWNALTSFLPDLPGLEGHASNGSSAGVAF